jgi:ribosomal protein S13
MARLAGVDLPPKKRAEIGLTYIYGIGRSRSLPVRGQRTHTNARTRKGPRRGTIANKKKAASKT